MNSTYLAVVQDIVYWFRNKQYFPSITVNNKQKAISCLWTTEEVRQRTGQSKAKRVFIKKITGYENLNDQIWKTVKADPRLFVAQNRIVFVALRFSLCQSGLEHIQSAQGRP